MKENEGSLHTNETSIKSASSWTGRALAAWIWEPNRPVLGASEGQRVGEATLCGPLGGALLAQRVPSEAAEKRALLLHPTTP